MSIWDGNTLCEEEIEELKKSTVFKVHEIEALYERFKYLNRSNTSFLTFIDFQMIPEFHSNPFSKLLINYLEGMNSFENISFASYLEFLQIFNAKTPRPRRISFLFNLFDIDQDSKISKSDLLEIQNLMEREQSMEAIEEVLSLFDATGKGYLDYEDFVNFYDSDPSFEYNMLLDLSSYYKEPVESGFWNSLWSKYEKDG